MLPFVLASHALVSPVTPVPTTVVQRSAAPVMHLRDFNRPDKYETSMPTSWVQDTQRGWRGPSGNERPQNVQPSSVEGYGDVKSATEKADALEATARERANSAANAAAAAAAKSLEASMRGSMPAPAAPRPVPMPPSNYGYMQRVGALQQSLARYEESSGRSPGFGMSVEEYRGEHGGRPLFGPWGGYDRYDQFGGGYYAGRTYAPLRGGGYYDFNHNPFSPVARETTARRLAREARRAGGVSATASLGQLPGADYTEATVRGAFERAEAAREAARKAQEYAEAAEQAASAQETAAKLRVEELAKLEQEAAAARDRANASAKAAAADASTALDAEMAASGAAAWRRGGSGATQGGPALGAARRFEPNVAPDGAWWQ